MIFFNKKRGFTLIELLVVIAIIGLLASIITASLSTARAKGRDAKRIADIRTIQLALEEYYNDNGSYPTGISANQLSNYLSVLPSDPKDNSAYKFDSWNASHGQLCNAGNPAVAFHLGAILEDTTNPALNQDVDLNTGYQICGSAGVLDFMGGSPACGSTAGSPDGCYDVTN